MPSAVIASIHYFASRRELEITFRSGRIYAFFEVPQEVVEKMRAAFSKGEFFNTHIRGVYRFERREPALVG